MCSTSSTREKKSKSVKKRDQNCSLPERQSERVGNADINAASEKRASTASEDEEEDYVKESDSSPSSDEPGYLFYNEQLPTSTSSLLLSDSAAPSLPGHRCRSLAATMVGLVLYRATLYLSFSPMDRKLLMVMLRRSCFSA
ncbi:hypothetical protein M758_UG187100 [Ceratodon purpureus]|nr:hypothetical protein M758_UG187100 [Ceratodon purpureus]